MQTNMQKETVHNEYFWGIGLRGFFSPFYYI